MNGTPVGTGQIRLPQAPVRPEDPKGNLKGYLSKAQGGHGIDNGAEAESKDIWLQSDTIGSNLLQVVTR